MQHLSGKQSERFGICFIAMAIKIAALNMGDGVDSAMPPIRA